jgi:ribosomal protein L37AE/L43A
MSTVSLAVRALFRDKGIDYFIEQGELRFACPRCQQEATMNQDTAEWACPHCEVMGSLWQLFDLQPGTVESRIYNPQRERRQIQSMFLQAIRDGGASLQRLTTLYDKTIRLLNYYGSSGGNSI